jgi:nitronate monooxygenase
MWPDTRVLNLLGVELPIIQAPMAGANGARLAVAVSEAGGLGSLPCAMLSTDGVRAELRDIGAATRRPFNLNFLCHRPPAADPIKEAAWSDRLAVYYAELGMDPAPGLPPSARGAFDDAMCEVVEEFRPKVVSFHFGLPEERLVRRVKDVGAQVLSSATSVEEAQWLESNGCDAVIAQGYEAGGHQGMFLTADVARQVGTLALVPQIVDAVRVPVIASGGIADGRGVAAAFALGAAAVQIGTAYLRCPEAMTTSLHRSALGNARDNGSVLTNVFTGRPARALVNRFVREAGPLSDLAPAFPVAYGAVAPLRATAEAQGSSDFSPLWCGQAGALAREMPAGDLTRQLASEAMRQIKRLSEDGSASV